MYKRQDKYRAALDAAAKQLSYRALSAKMLRDKLLDKGHDEEAADYALAWQMCIRDSSSSSTRTAAS